LQPLRQLFGRCSVGLPLYINLPIMLKISSIKFDVLATSIEMAKQKFRPTRLGGFSGAKAYIGYVKVLKN